MAQYGNEKNGNIGSGSDILRAKSMKPKAVIFSSGESLDIANDFASKLRHAVECIVWTKLPFKLGNFTQRELAAFGKQYDFALLVFGAEDKAVIRGEECNVTRDNVIYEYGLMSGLIGAERCIIIECFSDSIRSPHLPSDIKGIITVKFDTQLRDREIILHECVNRRIIPHVNKLGQNKCVSEDLISQLSVVGLSGFYRNRDDFKLRKSDDGRSLTQLKDYLESAHKSIKIVATTSAISNTYEKVSEIFTPKLRSSSNFTITISLLNPFNPVYFSSCFMSHDRRNPGELINEAKANLDLLREFRSKLSPKEKERFNIRQLLITP